MPTLRFHTTTLIAALLTLPAIAIAIPANAQTEVARSPWFAKGGEQIISGTARYFFPQIAANRRLEIQFVSCALSGTGDVYPLVTRLAANDAFSASARRINLAWSQREGGSYHFFEIAHPVVFTINAGERAQIGFDTSGSLSFYGCSLSGELVFLQ